MTLRTVPEISRRAVVTETDVSRRWRVAGSPLAVVESTSRLGLGTHYLVVRATAGGGEVIVSRHRHRRCAVFAAVAAARES